MKRTKIILLLILLLLATFILLLPSPSKPDPNAPAFIPWHNQPLPPFSTASYHMGANPFAGDKMWIQLISRSTTNVSFVNLLYDLENNIPLGELKNADIAVLANHDYSKLLCAGHESISTQWNEKFSRIIGKFTFGKIRLNTNTYAQTFWILDRQHNSARKIGELSQLRGNGIFFHPSPDSRHAYALPTAGDKEFFLCDLEKEKLTKIQLDGRLIGWWDDLHLLIRDSGNNFILFDVESGAKTMLWSVESLAQQLRQLGASWDPASLECSFKVWNGGEYDFYFSSLPDILNRHSAGVVLLKADRSTLKLKLAYSDFKLDFGELNAAGTHYVYNGIQNGYGDGSIYLRDLRNKTDRLLVAPTGKPGYAHPEFYNNSVIYFRSNTIWRVDLTGSNNAPLFPQPTIPTK